MTGSRIGRFGRPPRPWATALPVLLVVVSLPSIERSLHPGRSAVADGSIRGEVLPTFEPLQTEAAAEEVFDWLRSVERIAFEHPMELRLDIETPGSEATRLRATVVAASDRDLQEETR